MTPPVSSLEVAYADAIKNNAPRLPKTKNARAAPILTQETTASQTATNCDHYKPFQLSHSQFVLYSIFSEPNVHNPMVFAFREPVGE